MTTDKFSTLELDTSELGPLTQNKCTHTHTYTHCVVVSVLHIDILHPLGPYLSLNYSKYI